MRASGNSATEVLHRSIGTCHQHDGKPPGKRSWPAGRFLLAGMTPVYRSSVGSAVIAGALVLLTVAAAIPSPLAAMPESLQRWTASVRAMARLRHQLSNWCWHGLPQKLWPWAESLSFLPHHAHRRSFIGFLPHRERGRTLQPPVFGGAPLKGLGGRVCRDIGPAHSFIRLCGSPTIGAAAPAKDSPSRLNVVTY